MFHIITDSSAEFTEEEAAALGVEIVPLTVVFGAQAYLEGVGLKKDEFYGRLLAGEFPHTSMPSAEQFTAAYEREGGEETLVILISSALSGTVNAARLAAREGGFSNVHVYDSLCTTAMLRILVEEAVKYRGRTVAEAIAALDTLRPRIRLNACLDTLEYLYKGGRIKKSVAIIGELIGIKPVISLTPEGTVAMRGRAHGRKKALKTIADMLSREPLDPAYPVYFLQTNTDEFTREVMAATGHAESRIFRICCAVGSHIGSDAAGYVYVVKGE